MSSYKNQQTQLVQIGPVEKSDLITEITPSAFSWIYRMVKSSRDSKGISYIRSAEERRLRKEYLIADEWMDRLMAKERKGTDLVQSMYG